MKLDHLIFEPKFLKEIGIDVEEKTFEELKEELNALASKVRCIKYIFRFEYGHVDEAGFINEILNLNEILTEISNLLSFREFIYRVTITLKTANEFIGMIRMVKEAVESLNEKFEKLLFVVEYRVGDTECFLCIWYFVFL